MELALHVGHEDVAGVLPHRELNHRTRSELSVGQICYARMKPLNQQIVLPKNQLLLCIYFSPVSQITQLIMTTLFIKV